MEAIAKSATNRPLAWNLLRVICNLANICLLKVNNRNPRKRREICSKLTIKTAQRHQIFAGKEDHWRI